MSIQRGFRLEIPIDKLTFIGLKAALVRDSTRYRASD